jgi:MinD superfamily P-loop ATPase
MCHFGAIGPVPGADGEPRCYRVDEYACEGCGLCALICPVDAVKVSRAVTGQVFVSGTACGPLSHARLGIARENSGKLVTRVRQRAAELAAGEGAARVYADGSPGTGCPVIASISAADAALVVTEPTVSGVHDLERVLDLVLHFRVRPFVCVNKCDLNPDQARRVREVARAKGAEVVGEVPFDVEANRTLMEGKILVAASNGPAASAVRALAQALSERL